MKTHLLIALLVFLCAIPALAGPADDALKQAEGLLENGDIQGAVKAAEDGLTLESEHFKLLKFAGDAYYELEQYTDALVKYERALQQKKKDVETLYMAGLAALKTENFEAAEGYFELGVSAKKQARFYHGLGMAQTELEKYSEADLNIRKAIDKDEDVAEYHLALGEENFRNKVYPLAISEFKKAIELDSTLEKSVPDLHYKIGEAFLNQRDVLRAIAEYKEGLALFPDDTTGWKKLAQICEASGNTAEAVYCHKNIVRVNPQNGEQWFKLGELYIQINDKASSAEAFEKSISLNYNIAESFGQLAYLYGDQQQYEKSWDAYNRFEEVLGPPDSALYWYEKGKVGLKLGAKNAAFFDSAQYAFDKAIALDPAFSSSYEYAGITLYSKRDYAGAIPYFQKKIDLDSTSVNSLRNMAFCYLKTESYLNAAKTLEKALLVKPEDVQMRTMLGKIYTFNQLYGDAIKHFEVLLNEYGETLDDSTRCVIYPDLGLSYLKEDRCKKSIEVLANAEKCQPNDKTVLMNLALSYHLCNLIKDANKYYKKVLKIDPRDKDAIRGDLETTIQGQD